MDAYIDSIARGDTDVNPTTSRQPNFCEYIRQRDGETRHVLQLFCECNEVDNTLEDLMTSGRLPTSSRLQRLELDVSDRIRVPWPGGAVKFNLWFLIMPLLLALEYTVAVFCNCPKSIGLLFNVLVCWYSVRVMHAAESARTHFHLQFTGWAIFQVLVQYFSTTYGSLPNLIHVGVALPLMVVVVGSFYWLRSSNPGTLPAMQPPLHSSKTALADCYVQQGTTRGKYCHIAQVGVARYDHFCIWVGRPIGKWNHRWFLLFCTGVFLGGLVFALVGGGGELRFRAYHDVVVTRCVLGCLATGLLLLRQSWLITVGLTSYENLHCVELKQAGWKRSRQHDCMQNWKEVVFPSAITGGTNHA